MPRSSGRVTDAVPLALLLFCQSGNLVVDSTLQTRTHRERGGKRVGIMYEALLSEEERFSTICL